jgi:hypothetical protein
MAPCTSSFTVADALTLWLVGLAVAERRRVAARLLDMDLRGVLRLLSAGLLGWRAAAWLLSTSGRAVVASIELRNRACTRTCK